jgi:hypothetical protein
MLRRKHIVITALLAVLSLTLLCIGQFRETVWGTWTNCGSCSSTTVTNPNTLTGTQTQWASIYSTYGGSGVPANATWIPTSQFDNFVKLRFRTSAASVGGTVEIWGCSDHEDGEYIMDVNLVEDATPQPATMTGYYVGNMVDSNDANGLAGILGMQNCNNQHRMGVLIFHRQPWAYLIVHVKSIREAGTIYWDKCGY